MRTSLAHCGCDGALRDDYADRMELDHLVIAVVDTAVAAESRFGSWVAAGAADGPRLIGAVMRDVRLLDGPAGPRRALVRRGQAIAELAG